MSELIDPGVSIQWIGTNGTVTGGKLKYVKDWQNFSTNPTEQEGNFFPALLDEQYEGEPISAQWQDQAQPTTAVDRQWVLRVRKAGDTITFKTGENIICTIAFPADCLAQNTIAAVAGTPVVKTTRARKTTTKE